MSWLMEKIYALFRMNILIFVLLAATVIALTAYQKGLNDIQITPTLSLRRIPRMVAIPPSS